MYQYVFFILSLIINIYIQWYYLCTHKLPSTYTTLLPGPSDVVRWTFECPRVYNRPASVLDRTQGCVYRLVGHRIRRVYCPVAYKTHLYYRLLIHVICWNAVSFHIRPNYATTDCCIICACDECIYFLLKRTSPRALGERLTFLSFRKTIRPWHTAWHD